MNSNIGPIDLCISKLMEFISTVCSKQLKISYWNLTFIVILILEIIILIHLDSVTHQCNDVCPSEKKATTEANNPRNLPLIFIGGHQSSGTGLMRILLDVHPMIRCGPEPIVTREMLKYRRYMDNIGKWLQKTGYTSRVLDDATAAFITTVIKKMGPTAPRLCHKDPSTYIYLKDLGLLFPKAKFILMIRDGRAVVASTIARGINTLFTPKNITGAILSWEYRTRQILEDCQFIGSERCLVVRYECLVLNPRIEIQNVLDFLGVPWDDKLLQHEKYVHNTSVLNEYEASTSQIMKSIHTNSLNTWSRNGSAMSTKYIKFMNEKSILMRMLGYVTKTVPPKYEDMCYGFSKTEDAELAEEKYNKNSLKATSTVHCPVTVTANTQCPSVILHF